MKLPGKLIRANPYISTNIIPAIIKRRFEFDSLVFGLVVFRDPILLLLLPRCVRAGNHCIV
jgi:hypothetical protein